MGPRYRYVILGIVFTAYFLSYIDRLVIASALPFISKEFQLAPLAMGGVLSAFFFGYSLMQIPGGILSDRFGPRRVLTTAVVGWSAFTAATGMAASLSSMLGIRAIFGLFEGVCPPAASKALAIWFPKEELGRANGTKLAATQLAPALAPPLVAFIVLNWGWRVVFYVLLIPGVILAPVIWLYMKDTVSQSARAVPSASAPGDQRSRITDLMRMPSVLWCSATLFFANVANWGLMNWLPTYFLEARGLSVAKMGLYAALPYAAGTLGYYLGGHVGDKYFPDNRRLPVVVGLLAGAVFTYAAANAPTAGLTVVFFVATMLFVSAALSGVFSLPMVIVPPAVVGSTMGIVNTSGQVAAFLSPLMVGYALSRTGGNFTIVFYGLVCFFVIGAAAATRIRQPASLSTARAS